MILFWSFKRGFGEIPQRSQICLTHQVQNGRAWWVQNLMSPEKGGGPRTLDESRTWWVEQVSVAGWKHSCQWRSWDKRKVIMSATGSPPPKKKCNLNVQSPLPCFVSCPTLVWSNETCRQAHESVPFDDFRRVAKTRPIKTDIEVTITTENGRAEQFFGTP